MCDNGDKCVSPVMSLPCAAALFYDPEFLSYCCLPICKIKKKSLFAKECLKVHGEGKECL